MGVQGSQVRVQGTQVRGQGTQVGGECRGQGTQVGGQDSRPELVRVHRWGVRFHR